MNLACALDELSKFIQLSILFIIECAHSTVLHENVCIPVDWFCMCRLELSCSSSTQNQPQQRLQDPHSKRLPLFWYQEVCDGFLQIKEDREDDGAEGGGGEEGEFKKQNLMSHSARHSDAKVWVYL